MKKSVLLIIIMFFLTLPLSCVQCKFLHAKSWTTDGNSVLAVGINDDNCTCEEQPNIVCSFELEKGYSFTMTLTAHNFGSNIIGFYNITVALGFTPLVRTFFGSHREPHSGDDFYDSGYDPLTDTGSVKYELPSLGSTIYINLSLVVPSFSLDFGEVIVGHLRYKIDFKEEYVLGIDPSFSTGWQSFANGDIVDGSHSLMIQGFFILGLAIVVIICLSVAVFIIRLYLREK